MKLHATKLAGVYVAETSYRIDHRGSFARLFCEAELGPALGSRKIVQINHSRTRFRGSLRGLHFQRPPHAELKMVRCLSGRVWDVALDLRKGSATFMKWHAEELDAANARMLVIPEGCAHGFQTLTDNCELLYLHTAAYEKSAESGLRYDDPRAAISWPLEVTELSDRDRALEFCIPSFSGIQL